MVLGQHKDSRLNGIPIDPDVKSNGPKTFIYSPICKHRSHVEEPKLDGLLFY